MDIMDSLFHHRGKAGRCHDDVCMTLTYPNSHDEPSKQAHSKNSIGLYFSSVQCVVLVCSSVYFLLKLSSICDIALMYLYFFFVYFDREDFQPVTQRGLQLVDE
jgi:hypothetical protein